MSTPPQSRGVLPRPAFADSMPLPEAVERDTDSAWGQFQDLTARQDARFAQTVPQELPGRAEAAVPAPATRLPKTATLDDVLLEARRFNRVCPRPEHWVRLYGLLPDRLPRQPTAPLVGAAWQDTPALSKRMVLREQLEWADRRGGLGPVMDFLRALREEDWHHMGDD